MLFTFKTVALAVLAVVAVGNVQVQGAPLPSSPSSSLSVESSAAIAESQTQVSSVQAVQFKRCVFLLCWSLEFLADGTCFSSDNLDAQSSASASPSGPSSSMTTKESGVKKTYSKRRIARRHP